MRSIDAQRALNSRSLEQPQACIRHTSPAICKYHSRTFGLHQAFSNPSAEQKRACPSHAEAIGWKRTSKRTSSMHAQAASTAADTVEDLRRAEGEGIASSQALAEDAIVWASQHGLVVSLGDERRPQALVHAPLAVVPVPFPRRSFEQAYTAAPVFNALVDAVARDGAYLRATLRPAAEFDDFTARLLQLYDATEDVRQQRVSSGDDLVLGMNRSDYMLDEPSGALLQVELNTIASSFGSLSTLVSGLHKHILERAGRPDADLNRLPPNNAAAQLADAIGAAAAEFGDTEAAVLFVVQPNERNSYDQQWMATMVWRRHGLRVLRLTLAQVGERGRLGAEGDLVIDGTTIAVTYYRAGYAPTDYPTEAEWRAREMLERSTSAQCPSVAYQLAGAKKVQQDLAAPGALERFLEEPRQAELLRACFAGLWSLDDLEDPATKEVLADAQAHPERYVLKPQREGGGNNLYGAAAAERLRDARGLAAFILMQRIQPPINRSVLLREGQVLEVDSLSELGVYGTFVRRGALVIVNSSAGHLVRTKAATSDEGGVAAGFAVLDSPYLTD